VQRIAVTLSLLGLLVAACADAAVQEPALRVASRSPLVVRGQGFRAGEHVAVIAITGLGPRKARVVARDGAFRVRIAVPSTGCGAAYAARAVGDRGSRASVVFGEAAVCIPPPRD
jgi:hypothetical protein